MIATHFRDHCGGNNLKAYPDIPIYTMFKQFLHLPQASLPNTLSQISAQQGIQPYLLQLKEHFIHPYPQTEVV